MTLRDAIQAGDPKQVAELIAGGADPRYREKNGHDALIDAMYGRKILHDPRLLELLEVLARNGVELSGVSHYGESGLRVLSRIGRFDAVEFLLQAGADPEHLQWTPLIKAVALGTLDEVENLLQSGAPLESRDWWDRTPWLVAIQTGDIRKAKMLREFGADTNACGRCGKPPLFYAIENHHPSMLRWLLEIGLDPGRTDEFGDTCLITAVGCDNLECVEILLGCDVDIDATNNGSSAIGHAGSREVALRLLEAGADPAGLLDQGRRLLAGLAAEASEAPLHDVSQDHFLRARTRQFGRSNPEEFQEPFWEAMIRSGVSGYEANEFFCGSSSSCGEPVWCAQRYGQTITLLPDGRAVSIGGEHEDYYDPDFCIYNDVFIHERDGAIRILGYPESVFPPTDFHTATLIDNKIYIIGSLGYMGSRSEHTPVYRLDTDTWKIEKAETTGEAPGWIYRHRAEVISPSEILVSGGSVVVFKDGEDVHSENPRNYILNVDHMHWRRVPENAGDSTA